jgi:hypothetical protein
VIQPDEIAERRADDKKFAVLTPEEISRVLLDQMPQGFQIHRTSHYVVCYNTTKAYAEWCGSLYERLFRGFYAYWRNLGMHLHEPELPLVALVFQDEASYTQFARRELGGALSSTIGYYNIRTNRVNMYDLTGADGIRNVGRITNAAKVNQILSQPQAERTVATIVHEATHQLAYNSGLQTRYADNPFWVSEGLAVYFETPDLNSQKAWGSIGKVNQVNRLRFMNYSRNRPPDSLATLIRDDRRFRDPQLAHDAYGEAWALNYFLLRTKADEYVAYLKRIAARGPLVELTPDERLAEFQETFGMDLVTLDSTMLRYISKLR